MSSGTFDRDGVLTKLQGMKLKYARERIYENPVSLLAHFEEFEAYTSILESHYAQLREQEETKSNEVAHDEGEKKRVYDEQIKGIKGEKAMTQAQIDRNIDYRMSEIKAALKKFETECKSCRSHVNAMQSILKAYGDEAKSVR